MFIDIDKLREDLRCELLGAYFGGGFGGALIGAIDIDRMSDEELISFAKSQGINLNNYIVN